MKKERIIARKDGKVVSEGEFYFPETLDELVSQADKLDGPAVVLRDYCYGRRVRLQNRLRTGRDPEMEALIETIESAPKEKKEEIKKALFAAGFGTTRSRK